MHSPLSSFGDIECVNMGSHPKIGTVGQGLIGACHKYFLAFILKNEALILQDWILESPTTNNLSLSKFGGWAKVKLGSLYVPRMLEFWFLLDLE